MPAYRTETDGSRLALVITSAGLLAIGLEPEREWEGTRAPAAEPGEVAPTEATGPEAAAPRPRRPRSGTKQDMLVAMLRRPEGATVPKMVEATGWLPHSVRGAFAGALKQRLRLQIASETVEGRGRVYRIQD